MHLFHVFKKHDPQLVGEGEKKQKKKRKKCYKLSPAMNQRANSSFTLEATVLLMVLRLY